MAPAVMPGIYAVYYTVCHRGLQLEEEIVSSMHVVIVCAMGSNHGGALNLPAALVLAQIIVLARAFSCSGTKLQL